MQNSIRRMCRMKREYSRIYSNGLAVDGYHLNGHDHFFFVFVGFCRRDGLLGSHRTDSLSTILWLNNLIFIVYAHAEPIGWMNARSLWMHEWLSLIDLHSMCALCKLRANDDGFSFTFFDRMLLSINFTESKKVFLLININSSRS